MLDPSLRHFDKHLTDLRRSRGSGFAGLDSCEPVQVGPENVALEQQTHELTLADDLHQPGRLQLFDVMGEGGSAHPMRAAHGTAGRGVLGGADLLEDLEAPRLGQRAGDSRELPFGQPGVPRARHHPKVSLSRPRAQQAAEKGCR